MPGVKKHIRLILVMTAALAFAGQAFAQMGPPPPKEQPGLPTLPPMPVLGPNDTIPVPAKLVQNEWLPGQSMEWIWVQVPMPAHVKKKKAEWTRLRNAVYVTWPYAKRAGAIMNEINVELKNVSSESKRKLIIKAREKELKKEFTKPMSDLSVYQGKVLMKLINRQTGNNCYEIIKEYKGGLTARCWQTVAFFFGSNLKQAYNAGGDDREIEMIVMEVEQLYR